MDDLSPGRHGSSSHLRSTRIGRVAFSISLLMTAVVVAVSGPSGRSGGPTSRVPARNRPINALNSPRFTKILSDYREYGLPFPPPDARLIRFTKGVRGGSGCGENRLIFHLGFLLSSPGASGEVTILVGTRTWKTTHATAARIEIVDPATIELDCISADWVFERPFDLNVGLATAIQCAERGWTRLAAALLDRSLKTSAGHPYCCFYQPATADSSKALARMAWADCANQLAEPKSDRREILRRMELLSPRLGRPRPIFGPDPVETLRATLRPGTAGPGTDEALIDALVDMSFEEAIDLEITSEPRYAAVLERGFAAVPALIMHLDDVRLTRHARWAIMNSPPSIELVGATVRRILEGISGPDSRRILYDNDGAGDDMGASKARAWAWWESVRRIGEEEYLIQNAVPKKPALGEESTDYDNRQIVWLIRKKYPHRLPELYNSLINERPEDSNSVFAEAIGHSTLEHRTKIDLLDAGARQTDLTNRIAALWELSRLDQGLFAERLIETLDRLPSTPSSPYWSCPESSVANLAMETSDPQVWEALWRTARRADPALRMELLDRMCYGHIGSRQRTQRVQFVARFLDDSDVPSGTPAHMYDGPRAGFTLPGLSVRNLAADTLGRILKVERKQHPNADWTVTDWQFYREKVQAAYRREQQLIETR